MTEEQRSSFKVEVYGGPDGQQQPTTAVVSSVARTVAEFTSQANLSRLKDDFGQQLGCEPGQLLIVVVEDESEPNPQARGFEAQAERLIERDAVEWKRIAQLAVPAVAKAVSLRFCDGGVEAEKDHARNSMLARLEGGGWNIRQGIELIWSGSRDLDTVSDGCDQQDRALLRHVLSLVVESPDELLQDPALESVVRKKQAQLQRALTEEDPLWRAVARAATQPPGQSELRRLEAYVLGHVEPRGLEVSDGISRILRGERDEAVLTARTDMIDSGCLGQVLEYIRRIESGGVDGSSFPTVESLTAPNESTARFIKANQAEFTAIATASTEAQHDGLREQLQRWESCGWRLTTAVEKLWTGERRELALLQGVDPNSAHAVRALLERLVTLNPSEGVPDSSGIAAPGGGRDASTAIAAGGGAPASARTVEITTEEQWATLDRFAVKERSQRLKQRMQCIGHTIGLADFEVVRLLGTGANAFAYLARCHPGGKLRGHTDTLVVLKVLHRYRQPSVAAGAVDALTATVSLQDRSFRANVEKEARDPIGEFRDNLVHSLGTFWEDATQLVEYQALDPDHEFVNPHTAFIMTQFFSGHDMQ